MDNHGGRTSLPRAHRPRAPVMSAPAPLTAPLTPLRPPPPVTLTAPRPEADRTTNEYVETPIRGGVAAVPTVGVPAAAAVVPALGGISAAAAASATTIGAVPLQQHHHHHQEPPHLLQQQQRHQHHQQPPPPQPPRPTRPTRLPLPPPPPVTKQPATAALGKDNAPAAAANATGATLECAARPSIMCPECGRCRCDSCQQPRPLPSRWICENQCLCSAEAVIDYATCLCCVKGLFYHCSDSDVGGGAASCADDPCGCGPERRLARWGCLAALSCVLPCLWCYWPLQCCKRAIETCYAQHSRHGCRCRPPLNAATPEKRLLDSSPDF